ncbi:Na+/H+ antiporter NhaC [Kangiella koreensis]|uniref:Na+/H+ antiporter NhaC n=1 Tax=Kangiella koreensis (strain DSM 16069 / JCM 12317 / KCTC 12182 / SW-125) TaxID=523791 RepID=C7RC23_KANKD|nr:Na+/H+ antiporter NhaC [Kangiella koreensis]ACV26815.1 Na+/H+ antiporter NhaC [Kangiella koreensis DSM 16069]
MVDSSDRQPSMLQALVPVVFLIVLLFFSVKLFGSDSSYGANQIALILSAAIAVLIGLFNGQTWKELEAGIVDGISLAMGAMLILLMVGSLIGTWILAGTVPTMIYYGLQILSPDYFYVASCIICAIVAVSIGSSWTTAGTVGIGLIGISQGLGLDPAITAGAIISGAYFGDKMSPLSDTTNLAPAVTGTDLFTHIRHMVWTTTPSLIIALILFTYFGLTSDVPAENLELESTLALLDANFNITLWSLIPLVAVFAMAIKKVPAVATILIGALLGGIFAMLTQGDVITKFVNNSDLSVAMQYVSAVWTAMFSGFSISTGDEIFDGLLSRGGMTSMLNTVWLIICAMSFGAAMEKTGLLHKLVYSIIGMAKSTGSLIGSVLLTCIGMNIIAADQYIAIVLPGRMYRAEFKRRGLDAKNLSRTLEDAGTITSPLIPWNTCGAYMAATLGVATGAYWVYAFFNLVNPIVSFIYGMLNFKIAPHDEANDAI